MNKFLKVVLSFVAALSFVVPASAQFTTSTMAGRIVDQSGEPLVGAVVYATHTPSGTQYYATANADGYYTIAGMRPGGPYEVNVSFVGCNTNVYKDITLALSETYSLDSKLSFSETLNEVVVSGSASKFGAEKMGATTNISNSEMMNLPNASRSIASLTKLSPYANGMSFAGSDGRSTNFSVDGSNFNSNFGLSSNLPGGGTPISLDALEEVQLIVAPYDVRQSNFVGGAINAITKSGTNTFKGTVYTYYNDQNLRGNKINGEDLGERALSENKSIGVTFGGPIVKNKLFFFANVEFNKVSEQTIKYRAAQAGETGGTGLVSKVTEADMQRVYDRLKNAYGYDAGSYTDFPGGNSNYKILARLDWNITNDHKLAIRFNTTKNNVWYEPNGNSSDDGYRNKSYNRVGQTSMAFSNNMYGQMNNVWSIATELNSRFGEKVSNKFLFSYTNINDMRMSNSAIFPQIDIMWEDKGSASIPAVSAGYELFSYNNGVKNSVFNANDNVTIYLGAHKLTAGLDWERQNAQNSYMRNGAGYYRWATIDDFCNGALPMSACLTVGANGVAAPVGSITFNKFAAFVQDEWNITKQFKLTYGLRADTIVYDNSELMTNNAILSFDMGGRSVDTGLWPKTTFQISPRIGFNWDIAGDKSIIMRGGAGLFQGRLPLVFFTNMPQNAGMIQVSKTTIDGNDLKTLQKTDGTMVTDVNEMARILGVNTKVTPESGSFTNTINGVDRNFKMPQVAKVSLAFDYNVPVNFPFTITGEGMFSKTIYGVLLEDWAVNNEKVMTSTFAGEDNRYDYWAMETVAKNAKGVWEIQGGSKQYLYRTALLSAKKDAAAYVLTNTNKGYGWNAAITIKMQPVKGLDIMAAYAHTVSKELSGMPGSNASSAYQGLYTVNGGNFATLQNSQYVVPDKIMANIGYFLPFKVFHGNGLHINLYYSASTSGTYNYVTANDMNGDGNNADLMYIYAKGSDVNFVSHTYGKAPNQVTISAEDQAKAYDAFVAQDKYLSSHKGQYAEANSAIAPFVHRFDLRIAEDFAFKVGNTTHNFQLSVSLENIANMFNSSWGVHKWSCYQTSNSVYNITPLTFDYETYKTTGKPAYYMTDVDGKGTMPTSTYDKSYVNPTECWRVLFGIKYLFN